MTRNNSDIKMNQSPVPKSYLTRRLQGRIRGMRKQLTHIVQLQ